MTIAVIKRARGVVVKSGVNSAEVRRLRDNAEAEADRSETEADRAETNAAFAEEFSGPAYASQAAGESATTEGQFFRVPIGTTPETYTRYQRTSGGSVEAASLAATADLASTTAAKGAALIGIEDGGTVQDWFDQFDLMPTATANGTADDSASFATATGKTRVLGNGRAFHFKNDTVIEDPVLAAGGTVSWDDDVRVVFKNLIAGENDYIFDISGLTDTVSKSFDGTQNIYRLGTTGGVTVYGRSYARWFMSSTSGDQSRALTVHGWSGMEWDGSAWQPCPGEQWISTDGEYSLATLGPNTVIDATLTSIEYTGGAVTGGQQNIWGETKRFGLFPITGLDVFQCRFTSRGEIDGNASNSYDVANNFPGMRQGNSTARTITGAANNGSGLIRITAAGHGFTTGDEITIYNVGGTTEANETWTVTVIGANTFDLQGSAFTNTYTSGGSAIGAINQGVCGAVGLHLGEWSTAAANGYHRAPARSVVTNAYIHNVFRNCIVGNYGGDITLSGSSILGNCYIDHLLYADTCKSLTWDKLGVFGFCRNRMVQISAGSGVIFPYGDGLALHPIDGESTRAILQARSDIIGKISVKIAGDWDFSKLSPYGHMRSIAFGNAARNIEIDLGVNQVGSSDTTRYSIFKGGGGTCGEIVIRGKIQNGTLVKVIDDNTDTDFVNSDFSALTIDVRSALASTSGAYFDVTGDFTTNSTIGFRTIGGQGKGYDSLFSIDGAAEDNLWLRVFCQTLAHGTQVGTIGGAASGNRFANSKCRSAQPSATLKGQVQFDDFTYHSSLDRIFMPRVRGVTVANLPNASYAGAGAEATVTDANSPTLGATVSGGGSTYCGVVSDGTNWKVG